jgi:hypothetical protein
MNLDNMIFSMGSTFIFVSWICEADDKDKLQGRLFEDQENHEDFALSARSTEELTEKLSRLAMSKSTQASPKVEFNSDSGSESVLNSNPGSFHDKPGSFPMGLWNMASIHQEVNSSFLQGSSMKSGPFPFKLDNMAKSNTTSRRSRTSTKGTTHRSPRRPRVDHNTSRLYRPLVGS